MLATQADGVSAVDGLSDDGMTARFEVAGQEFTKESVVVGHHETEGSDGGLGHGGRVPSGCRRVGSGADDLS